MATARTLKDVSPHEFVKAYATHLKRSGKMELPEWIDIVKTGVLIELAPYDPDWGGLRVGVFRRIYDGSKRNGVVHPISAKAVGPLLLHQLQNMNIIDMEPRGGRRITYSWGRDLDQVAGRIVVVAP
ncbi:unnamed protein product [Fraxinus pennsylvanica]|uniref:40S ribosomal protein S19 n=1 Tax=Fraxinus pennsylvanica TaxID=56036 RepID=A0AAD2EC85_9LAMI|nr:unnamed protein product [Fraxinus pennsylvanica]